MHSFQLVGLGHEQFESLFQLTNEELKHRNAVRCIATKSPGFPCRISLQDAEVGDELLLLPHLHQPAASPYRASGPIFVRRGVRQRTQEVGDVPIYVSSRLISVRAYDAEHILVAARVCQGSVVAVEIEQFFNSEQVAYIHLHNAKQGCFLCQVNCA